MERAGPVFDAIFEHVDDPPGTPVAGNRQGVSKWLKRHVREPLDTYFAYEDASVQDVKEAARAAGFTGNTSQGALLTYMAFKSRVQGFVSKASRAGNAGREGARGVGRYRDAACLPFCAIRAQPLGFFTIFDGDFAKYIQDFADKNSLISTLSFHTSSARLQPQWQRTPRLSINGLW